MAWFNTGYKMKKALTIDHTKVSGSSDLTSFPVLISRTDADLKTIANSGNVQNSSGFDIIFTDSTETTKLDHEIEKYVSTTGEVEMWVRIPTLSHTTDTVIYMYFNNSAISTSQENITGVWDSNFKGVWHFNDNAANTTVKDSTSNSDTGTSAANTSSKTATGQVASGLTFNGTSDKVSASGITTKIQSGSLSYSCWFKLTNTFNTSSTADLILMSLSDTNSSNDAGLVMSHTDGKVNLDIYSGTAFQTASTTETSWASGTWFHICGTFSTTAGVKLYRNGVADGTNAGTGRGTTNSGTFLLGASWDPLWFAGTLDEMRVSNTDRSAGWVTTDYNSQSSPSTFYSVGPIITNYIFTDSLTSTDIGGNLIQWNVDSLTVSEITDVQAWNVDSLSTSDSTTIFVGTGGITDSLPLTEAISYTDSVTISDTVSIADISLNTATGLSSDILSIGDIQLNGSALIPTDSLSSSDVLLINISTLPNDGLTSTDVGGLILWGIDSVSITDSISGVSTLIPSDTLSTLDTVLYGISSVSSESLTVIDSTIYIGLSTLTDGITTTDSYFCITSTIPIDTLTNTDVSTIQSWGYDGLSVTDSYLNTGIGVFIDSSTVSDTILYTTSVTTTDGLTVLDAQLYNISAISLENITITDSYLNTASTIPLDALAGLDVGGLQGWGLDNLTATDQQLSLAILQLSDILTGQDVQIFIDTLLEIDAVTAIDVSTGLVSSAAGPTNNVMSSEDDLSISDTPLNSCALTITNTMTATEIGALQIWSQDVLTVSDIGGLQLWNIDILPVSSVTINIVGYFTTDTTSINETILCLEALVTIDNLSNSDIIQMGQSFVTSDSLQSGDLFLQANTATFIDIITIVDYEIQQNTYNVVESSPLLENVLYSTMESGIETLSTYETPIIFSNYVPLEILSALDPLSSLSTFTSNDILSVGDIGTLQNYGIDTLYPTDTIYLQLLVIPVENVIITDVSINMDTLSALDTAIVTSINTTASNPKLPPSNATFFIKTGIANLYVRQGGDTAYVRQGHSILEVP